MSRLRGSIDILQVFKPSITSSGQDRESTLPSTPLLENTKIRRPSSCSIHTEKATSSRHDAVENRSEEAVIGDKRQLLLLLYDNCDIVQIVLVGIGFIINADFRTESPDTIVVGTVDASPTIRSTRGCTFPRCIRRVQYQKTRQQQGRGAVPFSKQEESQSI